MDYIQNTLLSGLRGYEIVMLVLGIILFFILSAQLVLNNKEKKNSVYSFIIPIIMMGYPGIQEIIFESGKITIKSKTESIIDNDMPDEEELVQFEKGLDKFARRVKTAEDISIAVEGYMVIGKTEKAIVIANKGLEQYSDDKKLLQMKHIAKNYKNVQIHPNNIDVSKKFDESINLSTEVNRKIKNYYKQKLSFPAERKFER